MAAVEALWRMGRDDLAASTERRQMVFDFMDPDTDPRLIEVHCAHNRKDLPRGQSCRWHVAYCAYCAVFHDINEAFTREQRDAPPEDRFCVNWSNPRSRAKFRQERRGCTMWPNMATTGKGNILEIAADRRWAFKCINVPGETRCIEPHVCSLMCADARSPQLAVSGLDTRRREALEGSIFDVGLVREPRRTDGAASEARAPSTAASEIELASYVMTHLEDLKEYDGDHCRRTQARLCCTIRTVSSGFPLVL